jgi:GNAT superfamily N-acetyltransferase
MLTVIRCAPLRGSVAEPLWWEGEASYVGDGRAARDAVTAPAFDLLGWCALQDGAPVGLRAVRLHRGAALADSVLAWVRPAFRGQGVWRALAEASEAWLRAERIGVIRSTVVAGGSAAAMAAALASRGSRPTAEAVVTARVGPVVYAEWRQPL